MPKQISPIVKIKGTIDQLTFFKTQDGYLMKEKSGVSGDRIKSDPAFKNTRRNGKEFGTGCKAGKVFRTAFMDEITIAADNRVISRISKSMVAIAKSDSVSVFGERRVENGNIKMLEGLEFNLAAPFSAAFKKELTYVIDRVTGEATINIPDFIPENTIAAPDGVTHYRLFAAAGTIDFATGKYAIERTANPIALYNAVIVAPGTLEFVFPPASDLPVFIVMGIEYMMMINGVQYSQAKKLNSLSVIAVDQS